MISLKGFLFDNKEKGMTIKAWIYAAYYRAKIKLVPAKKMENKFGIRGEESPLEVDLETRRTAKRVGYHVGRTCTHTPWQSKCLVQALTARKLLLEKGIASTLYLGMGYDPQDPKKEKLVAHAWIRVGNLYVTGGDGSRYYGIVAKFHCKP